MQEVVSSLFIVMHFPHNECIITIDQLDYVSFPCVLVYITLTHVNYVALYPVHLISTKNISHIL